MREPRRQPLLIGFVASVILHGAALVLLWPGRQLPRAAPDPAAPLLVELVRGRTAVAVPVAAPAPVVPPGSPAGRPARPSRPEAAPSASPPQPPHATGSSAVDPRGWFEAHGLDADAPRAAVDLGLQPPRAGPGPGGGVGPGGADGGPAPSTAESRVGAALAEAQGQYRVRHGLDPSWIPVAERLRAAFTPDWSLLDEGPKRNLGAGSGLARTFQGYLRMAERFARSERLSDVDGAMGERTSEGGKVVDRMVKAGGQTSLDLPSLEERLENPFQRQYQVLVEVAHLADGAIADVQLRRSCGHGPVDRLALAATRRALAELERRPVLGEARLSIWAFTVTFEVVPPAPSLGCPPDVIWRGQFDRCAYPLKKSAAGRVELYALE